MTLHQNTTTPNYEYMEVGGNENWNLDKRVNISHILTTIAIATSIVFFGAQLKERVSLLEKNITFLQERIDQVQLHHRGDIIVMEKMWERQNKLLLRIEEKLDQNRDRIEDIRSGK